MMSTKTSPKIGSTETCKNMAKIALNIVNVYLNMRFETCVWVLRSGAMWMPCQGHISSLFDGQCHMEMIFIWPLGDVAEDVVPPKSDVATVASDVDYVRAMTWHALSANCGAVYGFKGVHFDVPSNISVFPQTLSVV